MDFPGVGAYIPTSLKEGVPPIPVDQLQLYETEPEKAAEIWRNLADQGNLEAHFSLGMWNDYKNWEKAAEHYLRAAEGGHQQAKVRLGHMAQFDHVKKSGKPITLQIYSFLAQQAECPRVRAEAANQFQYIQGLQYLYGVAVPLDLAKAYEHFWYAGQGGMSDAKIMLESVKKHPSYQQFTLKIDLFLAKNGDVEAHYRCALAYEKQENFGDAYKHLRLAAKRGYRLAQERLESDSECINEQYPAAAFELYSYCAENGDETAHCQLGKMCLRGLGVNRNFNQAVEHFQRAADQGDDEATCFFTTLNELETALSKGDIGISRRIAVALIMMCKRGTNVEMESITYYDKTAMLPDLKGYFEKKLGNSTADAFLETVFTDLQTGVSDYNTKNKTSVAITDEEPSILLPELWRNIEQSLSITERGSLNKVSTFHQKRQSGNKDLTTRANQFSQTKKTLESQNIKKPLLTGFLEDYLHKRTQEDYLTETANEIARFYETVIQQNLDNPRNSVELKNILRDPWIQAHMIDGSFKLDDLRKITEEGYRALLQQKNREWLDQFPQYLRLVVYCRSKEARMELNEIRTFLRDPWINGLMKHPDIVLDRILEITEEGYDALLQPEIRKWLDQFPQHLGSVVYCPSKAAREALNNPWYRSHIEQMPFTTLNEDTCRVFCDPQVQDQLDQDWKNVEEVSMPWKALARQTPWIKEYVVKGDIDLSTLTMKGYFTLCDQGIQAWLDKPDNQQYIKLIARCNDENMSSALKKESVRAAIEKNDISFTRLKPRDWSRMRDKETGQEHQLRKWQAYTRAISVKSGWSSPSEEDTNSDTD